MATQSVLDFTDAMIVFAFVSATAALVFYLLRHRRPSGHRHR